jgi:hypothetical protein
LIARALASACRGHQELVRENIALRHQLRELNFGFIFASVFEADVGGTGQQLHEDED